MPQSTDERPALQSRSDIEIQGLENSKFKPGLLGHYESVFTKKNIFNSLLFYNSLLMPHKLLGVRLYMISTLNLKVKL